MRMPDFEPENSDHHRKLVSSPQGTMSRCNTFHAKTSPYIGLPPWDPSLNGVNDYGAKLERNSCTLPLVSARWSPTPEQLQALEEMYKHGVRTPTAEQIQQIVARLRRFGRIEGKNVFYWFQNHKAREKQRKRRRLELLAAKKMQEFDSLEQSGSMKCFSEHQSTRPSTPSNCNLSWKGWQNDLPQQITAVKSSESESCWPLELSPCIFTHNFCEQKLIPFEVASTSEINETRTLELFPIKENKMNVVTNGAEDGEFGTGVSVPNYFFEFLPVRGDLM